MIMHSTRTNEHRPLHIFFFPFPAHGHTAPMVDMARLFSSQGIKATLITTPLNIPFVSKTLTSNDAIHVKTINLANVKADSTQGCKIQDKLSLDTGNAFFKATTMLQDPLERAMLESCIIADMFFPWATQSAAKFGIPWLAFYVSSIFSLCASECMRLYHPYDGVSTDSEVFVIPSLPGEITMTRIQVEDYVAKIEEPEYISFVEAAKKSCSRSYGLVINGFYELERDYFDFYRNVLGKKVWHIPLSLYKRDLEQKANRGKKASMEEHECLKWLDTKKPNSVIYVCFGTLINVPESQLREIAMGLEASGQQFIWVVRKSKKDDDEEEDKEEWLPSGFEERTQGKGLIMRNWAPQVLILEHEAIGSFVTHCDWNAVLEGVSAGVPMITWPWYAEQFYNEILLTQVLKIGVPMGAKKWSRIEKDDIKWDAIEKILKRTMEGEEAEEMRNRAKVLAQKARQVVEQGGPSYFDLDALIKDVAMRS